MQVVNSYVAMLNVIAIVWWLWIERKRKPNYGSGIEFTVGDTCCGCLCMP